MFQIGLRINVILSLFFVFSYCLSLSNPSTISLHATKKLNFEKTLPNKEEELLFLQSLDSSLFEFKLTNFNNSQYVGPIYIGSNTQPINVIFDTGSHYLVIPDQTLTSKFANVYNCNTSTSCLAFKDQTVLLSYGQGNGYGYIAQDQISLGDKVIAENTTFVVATDINNFPKKFHADGVLGLRKIKNPQDYLILPNDETLAMTNYSLLDNLKSQGVIPNTQFSFFLNNEMSSHDQLGAEFILGGYNPNYIRSNFTKFQVISDNYWAIEILSFQIGSTNVNTSQGVKAVLDTGTSVIVFPTDLYALVVEEIKAKTACSSIRRMVCVCHKKPCNLNPEDFPTISFHFNGMNATLPGRAYVLNIKGTNVILLAGIDLSERFILLGDPFLRQYITLFDGDEDSISLAESIYFIDEPSSKINKYLVGIIFATVIVACLFIALYCFVKKKKEEEGEKIQLLQQSKQISL